MRDRFSKADLAKANARLKMLCFYPPDSEAQSAVMELLAKMCPHLEALNWLVDAMVNHIGTWKGPMELRGLLCWRYPPADGVEAVCSIPGFTPEDGELISLEQARHDLQAIESADSEMRSLVKSTVEQKRLP
jgi:hypothetical protein